MASPQASQPISKAGIAFFSSLCASTFGLGCWQSQRYFEKIEMVESRNKEINMEPLYSLEKNAKCTWEERKWSTNASTPTTTATTTTTTTTKESDDMNKNTNNNIYRGFRPIYIKGKFMHEFEILVGPRGPPPGAISSSGPNSGRSTGAGMSSSPQGYYVITPFQRSDDMGTVLINRGWVPRQYVISSKDQQQQKKQLYKNEGWGWDRPRDIVNVVGVASKTEREFILIYIANVNQWTLHGIYMIFIFQFLDISYPSHSID